MVKEGPTPIFSKPNIGLCEKMEVLCFILYFGHNIGVSEKDYGRMRDADIVEK